MDKKLLIRHFSNLIGWRTQRKIVVIESDDWGSIRMPSLKAYQHLIDQGVPVAKGDAKRYNAKDTLASQEDLSHLFDTLSKFRDANNQPPVITAISLVANPDFKQIKENGFQKYVPEPFTDTLARYGQEDAFSLWQEGRRAHLFVPQFHGREHLNIQPWLRALQAGEYNTVATFEQGCWAFRPDGLTEVNFQAAFDLDRPEDVELQKEIIIDGLDWFEQLHGCRATYMVPPNGPFSDQLESTAASAGIKYLATAKIHKAPLGSGKHRNSFRYLGKMNQHQQVYLTRNCFFEPSRWGADRALQGCLQDIDIAFRWKKPAVISSHRVNYIGGLDEKNRHSGMRALQRLLQEVVQRYPSVEFMTSTALGEQLQ